MVYEDEEGRQMFGFDMHCTDSQQREILARVRATPEWLRWGVLDYQVKYGRFSAVSELGVQLCRETAEADVALSRVVLRIITDVLR